MIEVSSLEDAIHAMLHQSNALGITSVEMGHWHHLHVLSDDLSTTFMVKHSKDDAMLRTILISKQASHLSTGRDKSCLALNVPDEAGCLFNALSIFKEYNINLCNLASLPSTSKQWKYEFFIEVEGHLQDSSVQQAIQRLQQDACLRLRTFGSYEKAQL